MAITKVTRELLSTGIDDNSNATAITIDSSEDVTLAGHLSFADSKNAKFGAGSDLQIYHNGSHSYISDQGTGNLHILTNHLSVHNAADDAIIFHANEAGHVIMPNQPAFLAKTASTMNNLTVGQNTTITFGTEIFDQNADFASNTFTAPVTGKYQLNTTLYMTDLDIDTAYYQLALITSNRSFYHILNSSSFASDATYQSINLNMFCDMDASDTAYVQMQIAGSGANQADVTVHSYFSGYLVA